MRRSIENVLRLPASSLAAASLQSSSLTKIKRNNTRAG